MKVRREIKREDIKKDEKLNNSQCWLDKVKNAQEKKMSKSKGMRVWQR